MDENSIDDVKKYPALIAVNDIISTLGRNQQKYIRSVCNDLKDVLKEINLVYNTTNNKKLNNYLINLIREDFIKRVKNMGPKYEDNLKTHMENYIFAKTRNLIKNK